MKKRDVEKAVLVAAAKWWRGHRPLSFTKKKHIESPMVNVTLSEGEHAERLAQAVADWEKLK